MRKSILLLLFLGLFHVGAHETRAQCTCAPQYRDIRPHKEFKLADAVFIGKVIGIKRSDPDRNNRFVETVKFEVTKAWKQDLEAVVVIENKILGCVNGFEEGEEWLVYAYKNQDGTLGTYCCCSRTSSLSKAEEDLKEFEAKGEQPTRIKRPHD